MHLQRQQRRDEHQRQAGQGPVGGDLDQDQHGERVGRQRHLLQRAVGKVVGEKPVERQHGGEQSRHPDDAGRDRSQHGRFGAEAKRKQADDDDEEDQRRENVRAAA